MTGFGTFRELVVVVTSAFAAARGLQAWRIWRRKARLYRADLDRVPLRHLLARGGGNRVWLGRGFEWTFEHVQRAFDIKRASGRVLRPPAWYRLLSGHVLPGEQTKGAFWLHGLELDERDIALPLRHLDGNTIVFGTTGAGKTRFFDLLVTQAIARGDSVLIYDPKGDQGLRRIAERACALRGREFRFFHPAYPDRSCRLDPMRNWNRTTELASRIAALIPSETGSDAFVAFGWRVINVVVHALIYVHERPNLRNIAEHVQGGPDALMERALARHFDQVRPRWAQELRPYLARARDRELPRPSRTTSSDLVAMVAYYRDVVMLQARSQVIDALISLYEHNRDHQIKMIASLLPILSMLTSGSLGELLSPDAGDLDDVRPITDSKEIIDNGQVLYIGTDSLSDATVGPALGSIFLADLTAVAGDRYNYGVDDRPASVFIDEAAEIINAPFVQLINKGRGARFTTCIAAQTFPDFSARTGGEARARQILGNVNNVFAFRTKDAVTQEFITEAFGRASVASSVYAQSTTAVVGERDVTHFSGGYDERRVEDTRAELFAQEFLGRLPDLHYVASVSAGRIVKGRIPLLSDEQARARRFPWLRARLS